MSGSAGARSWRRSRTPSQRTLRDRRGDAQGRHAGGRAARARRDLGASTSPAWRTRRARRLAARRRRASTASTTRTSRSTRRRRRRARDSSSYLDEFVWYAKEELLACVIARLIGGARARRGRAPRRRSPPPGVFLQQRATRRCACRCCTSARAIPFTEGSRELFDLAGQGRIDVFFLGGAQIDGEAQHQPGARRGHGASRARSARPSCTRWCRAPSCSARSTRSARWCRRSSSSRAARQPAAPLLTGKALFSWQKDRRRFRLESVHPGIRPTRCATTPGLISIPEAGNHDGGAVGAKSLRCCGARLQRRSRPTTPISPNACGDNRQGLN